MRGHRKLLVSLLLVLPLTFGAFLLATGEPSDISGQYSGDEWGNVELKQTATGEYSGTYTDTFDHQPGKIDLKWSRIERRYNGTWRESDNRFGNLSVRQVDGEIRGAWTTDRASKINPATPALADLLWTRAPRQSQASDSENLKAPSMRHQSDLIGPSPREAVNRFLAAARTDDRKEAEYFFDGGDLPGTSAPNLGRQGLRRIHELLRNLRPANAAETPEGMPRPPIEIENIYVSDKEGKGIAISKLLNSREGGSVLAGRLTIRLYKTTDGWRVRSVSFSSNESPEASLKAFRNQYKDAVEAPADTTSTGTIKVGEPKVPNDASKNGEAIALLRGVNEVRRGANQSTLNIRSDLHSSSRLAIPADKVPLQVGDRSTNLPV